MQPIIVCIELLLVYHARQKTLIWHVLLVIGRYELVSTQQYTFVLYTDELTNYMESTEFFIRKVNKRIGDIY